MTDTVKLTIASCDMCPNQTSERYYTGDSFETCFEWKCSAAGKKTIAILDWNDKKPKIPSWCPLR